MNSNWLTDAQDEQPHFCHTPDLCGKNARCQLLYYMKRIPLTPEETHYRDKREALRLENAIEDDTKKFERIKKRIGAYEISNKAAAHSETGGVR